MAILAILSLHMCFYDCAVQILLCRGYQIQSLFTEAVLVAEYSVKFLFFLDDKFYSGEYRFSAAVFLTSFYSTASFSDV